MINKNTLKLLILLAFTTFVVTEAYGYAEAEQSLKTTVQPAVAISKDVSSVETTSVDAASGEHNGLQSIFNVNTNGTDDNYDFIMYSYIMTDGGAVSAYSNNGSILFGHSINYPSTSSIEDAKAGGNKNYDIIVYPVSVMTSDPMTASFKNNFSVYGDCYVIKLNGTNEGAVTHRIGRTPVSGSYNVGQDRAGSYKSTVVLTAVSK